MKVIEEKTRLIISEYTPEEERSIEGLISSFDGKLFLYRDEDKKIIYLPSGIKKQFVDKFKVKVIDNSKEHWPYDNMKKYDLTIEPRDQSQSDAIDHVMKYAPDGNKIGLILPPGYGKGHPVSTKIPAPNNIGHILMGDMKVGDKIFGSDGKQIFVDEIFELGMQDIYKVTFADGLTSLCTYEHLWEVIDSDGSRKTLMLKDMIDNYEESKYNIPVLSFPVEYDGIRVDDAYAVGLSTCNETIDKKYLYNDIDTRLELLQGLVTSCGTIDSRHEQSIMTYSTYNEKLLFQVRELVLGLGFTVLTHDNGKPDGAGYYGTLTFHSQFYYDKSLITNIEFSHREEARCISVSAADALYLSEDYVVTHNTMISIYCAIKMGMKTLIIVPTSSLLKQWKDSLMDMFSIPEDKINMVDRPMKFINTKADFTIVLHQTLSSLNKRYDLEKIMKSNSFGTKIIDEAHMYFKNIIVIDGSSNIKDNWYLTATFGRSSESENEIYYNMYGSIKMFHVKNKKPNIINRRPGDIYGNKPHVNTVMYWTKSGLTPEEVKEVSNNKQYSEREQKWIRYGISVPAYLKKVIPPDGTETRFLKKCLKVIAEAGKVPYGSMLILTPTIYSVAIIKKHVEKMFPDRKIGTIHSKNTKEENDDAKKNADIIISTIKSTGTGFDAPGLSTCVVIEAFKSSILARQVFGRLRRRKDGRDTYYFDIVDASVNQLVSWANIRADIWKQLSKTFKVKDI